MRVGALSLLLLASGCGSEVSIAESSEAACHWRHRDVATIAAKDVTALELVPSREGDTVALVFGSDGEGVSVVRWPWAGVPGPLQALAPPPSMFPVVAEGPDDAVAVLVLDGSEGLHRLFEEGRGEVASFDLLHERAVRYLGPSRDDGGRPIVLANHLPGSTLEVVGSAPEGLLGCWTKGIEGVSTLPRGDGYLVANITDSPLGKCHPHENSDRVLEVFTLDDGLRELTHVVPFGEETATGQGELVRLVATAAGPALVYGIRPISYGYGIVALTRWLLPLTADGEPAGDTVELGVGLEILAAAPVGDAVALVDLQESDLVIRLVQRDGTERQPLLIPRDDLLVVSPLRISLASNPSGDTVLAAVSDDGETVAVHAYDCVAP